MLGITVPAVHQRDTCNGCDWQDGSVWSVMVEYQ